MTTDSTKSRRGFAAMSPERRREISAMGGRAVDPAKRSFSQNNDLARRAGRKGGQSVDPAKRNFSVNRELSIAAGRKGGLAKPRKEAR
jgi:general stress protein YciG